MTQFLSRCRCVFRFSMMTALAGSLPLLSGCLDLHSWRVDQPAAVSVLLGSSFGGVRPIREILPASVGPADAEVPYTYRPPRNQSALVSDCPDGTADEDSLIPMCQGLALLHRGSQSEIDLDIGLLGDLRPIVKADGTIPYKLATSGYDAKTDMATARLPPLVALHSRGLELLLQTPRSNLRSAVRMQRRQPVFGAILLGLSSLSALVGAGFLATLAESSNPARTAFLQAGIPLLGISLGSLGAGIWMVARPEKDIPL